MAGRGPRWRGVPLYPRTGKRMAVSGQRVSLILREPPGPLSGRLPPGANVLSFSLAGDRSLFTRPDGLAAVWDTAEPLLSTPPPVSTYSPGSWGPAQARDLITPGRWLLGQ